MNYLSLIKLAEKAIVFQKKRSVYLTLFRVIFGCACLIFIYFLIQKSSLVFFILVTIFSILFFFITIIQKKIKQNIDHQYNIIKVCELEIEAKNNNGLIEEFNCTNTYSDTPDLFSSDLDIFGQKSIFCLLNRAITTGGHDCLAYLLTNPFSDSNAILDSQKAIIELRNKIDWRVNFLATGKKINQQSGDYKNFIQWLSENTKVGFIKLPNYFFYFFGLLHLTILCFGFYKIWLFLTLVQSIYTFNYKKEIDNSYLKISRYSSVIENYLQLFSLVEQEHFTSNLTLEIHKKISKSNSLTSSRIRSLIKISKGFQIRNVPLGHFILNTFFLWDFWCALRFEQWKEENSQMMLTSFMALNELEVLIGISFYSYLFQDYTFPVLSDSSILQGKQLGHPLVNSERIIYNDFSFTKNEQIYVITGANMAGKSTFLRTIGVNYLLAMIGAPVCAKEFSFIPATLITCMRISDSIQNNSSYFQAELTRLKLIIECAKKGNRVFLLLDELLKGTNSVDKLKGSELFIEKLLTFSNVKGLIATHDLELTKIEEKYPTYIKNICFEISINNNEIEFDYKLKDGVTKTMNAQFLMQKMNII